MATGLGMRDPHVLAALKEKRARLAGDLVMAQMRIIALKADLAHVDGVLKIFRSDVDPKSIEKKPGRIKEGCSEPHGTRNITRDGRGNELSGTGRARLTASREAA